MSLASRLFRRGHRVSAEQRKAEELSAELKRHPPLTIVARMFDDRIIGIGVRLDTSICLRPKEKEREV